MYQRKLGQKQSLTLTFALGLIAIISYFAFDQVIAQSVSTEKHTFLYRPIRELTEFAEGKYYFAIILLLLLSSALGLLINKLKPFSSKFIVKFQALFNWSKFAFFSMLTGGLILQVVKHVVGRQRPHMSPDNDPQVFDFFTANWHYHSFPSGHAQTVFTFAAVLWITFPRLNKYFFLAPLLLSLTRLPLEEHFLSDVIAGGILGFYSTLWVANKYHRLQIS